jgi:NAD-dependent SIR2 family protein deacetylase
MSLPPQIDALEQVLAASHHLLVLTGAGCSTESGIPDYRDQQGAWKRPPPMYFQEFVSSASARQRYWARGSIGWQRMRDVQPGRAHRALARFEAAGRIDCLITQNVDGLHQRAGSRRVIDLHGRIDAVDCLHCHRTFPRREIQARLEAANPLWSQRSAALLPDGDVELEASICATFQVVDCEQCRGTLKPAVVFFGEAVPEDTVVSAYQALARADALLVVGSSLMVYSGYRFVRAACERGLPVAVVNRGVTRADAQVSVKIEAGCGDILEQLATRMIGFDSRIAGDA